MLKKYIEFIKENDQNDNDFVKLKSISSYLNINNGKLYKLMHDDTYGYTKDLFMEMNNLSQDDRKIVDKYSSNAEPYIKEKLNYDLINDIIDRCVSEELIDNDVRIYICITYKTLPLLTITLFQGDNEKYIWDDRLFKDDIVVVKDIEPLDIGYNVFFSSSHSMKKIEEYSHKIKFIEKVIKDDYSDSKVSFLKL